MSAGGVVLVVLVVLATLAGLYLLTAAVFAASFGVAMWTASGGAQRDELRELARAGFGGGLLRASVLTGLVWPVFLTFMIKKWSEPL